MRVIGFSGKAGAGKTTAAQIREDLFDLGRSKSRIISFADPLKQMVRTFWSLPYWMVYGDKQKKETIDPFWKVSGRELLQYMGTEMLRYGVCHDIHNKAMERRIEKIYRLDPDEVIIIDDVRFPNELALIHKLGGIVYNIKAINQPDSVEKTTVSRRTLSDWQELVEFGYEDDFIRFLKNKENGITHQSETEVDYDYEIENDFGPDGIDKLTENLRLI